MYVTHRHTAKPPETAGSPSAQRVVLSGREEAACVRSEVVCCLLTVIPSTLSAVSCSFMLFKHTSWVRACLYLQQKLSSKSPVTLSPVHFTQNHKCVSLDFTPRLQNELCEQKWSPVRDFLSNRRDWQLAVNLCNNTAHHNSDIMVPEYGYDRKSKERSVRNGVREEIQYLLFFKTKVLQRKRCLLENANSQHSCVLQEI